VKNIHTGDKILMSLMSYMEAMRNANRLLVVTPEG
jgi:hypothetical protein